MPKTKVKMKSLLPIISTFLLLNSQTAWSTTQQDKNALLIKAGKVQLIEPCTANQKLERAQITLFPSEIEVHAQCMKPGEQGFRGPKEYVHHTEANLLASSQDVLTLISSRSSIKMQGRETLTVTSKSRKQLNLMLKRENGSPCLKIRVDSPREMPDMPEVWTDIGCQAAAIQIGNRILVLSTQLPSAFQIQGLAITTTPTSNDQHAAWSDRKEIAPIQQFEFNKTGVVHTAGAVRIIQPCGKNIDPAAAQILLTQARVLLNFACLAEGEIKTNQYGVVQNTFAETDYLRIVNRQNEMPNEDLLSWSWLSSKKPFPRMYTLQESSGKTCNRLLVTAENDNPFEPTFSSPSRPGSAPLSFAFDQDCKMLAIFALDLVALMPANSSEDFWVHGVRIRTGDFATKGSQHLTTD